MATVFASPTDLPAPGFDESVTGGRFDHARHIKLDAEYVRRLARWAERHTTTARDGADADLIGEEVRFPVADGYARCIVWEWHADEALLRGLTIADVRERVEFARRVRTLVQRGRASTEQAA